MDIRNSLNGLRTLLGVNAAVPPAPQGKKATEGAGTSFDTDRATLSSAGNQVSQVASEAGVRTDKVANVQIALAAGTYRVPASAVASKLVDAMLSPGR